MNKSWNSETLKIFIKDTLGCGCPDKVFDKIEVEKQHTDGYANEFTRIVVGDTLLIYIVQPSVHERFSDRVEVIGMAGKADRDANRYNRFRLVVAPAVENSNIDDVLDRFISEFGADGKMHIHSVSINLLAELGI